MTQRRASSCWATTKISQFDCQIAAIACAYETAVATRNTGDYEGCGIDVIDPWLPTGRLSSATWPDGVDRWCVVAPAGRPLGELTATEDAQREKFVAQYSFI